MRVKPRLYKTRWLERELCLLLAGWLVDLLGVACLFEFSSFGSLRGVSLLSCGGTTNQFSHRLKRMIYEEGRR